MDVDQIRKDWQSQPAALNLLTENLVQRRARTKASRIRFEGMVDTLGNTALGLAFLATAWVSDTWLCRIGCALAGAGQLYTAAHVLRIALAQERPSVAGLLPTIAVYRGNLDRLRASRNSVLTWAILPSAPGIAIALLGWLMASPEDWASVAKVASCWLGVSAAGYSAFSKQSSRLSEEIALLDAASSSNFETL